MFFELLDRAIINLNHVTEIPVIHEMHASAIVIMIDGKRRLINKKDAQEIRDICKAGFPTQ